MDEIAGVTGELADRLIVLLNCDALGEGEWYSVGFYTVFFLGGATLGNVAPDTGTDPVPGSVGERVRQLHELVSRDRYFELIRARLSELISNGIEEAFLVRSLRDAMRRQLESVVDFGKGDRNRAELRAHFQRIAEDTAEIAAFRARLAADDPSAETLGDDEIATRLRKMSESEFLLPTSPDIGLDRWATLTHWDRHAVSLLPDAVFDEWRQRMVHRLR